MSRFWAAGGSSSSDSESDSDSSSDSDDSGHSGGGGNAMNDANRWLAMSDDSSDEDSVRVVLSGAERFQETVKGFLSDLKKHMKARDYYQIQVTFDALAKAMIKNKQYLSNGVPRPLVRILCDLEDYTAERLKDKEQFKKLSARQGRALNRMKLTLRKHNKAYATVMKAYRANPVVSDAESESSDDDVADDASASSSGSSSSSNSGSSSSSSSSDGSGKEKDSDDDSDGSGSTSGDDDEWDSDSDDSASEDDGKEYAQLKGRARWLKKNTVATTKVVKNKEDRAKEREAAKLAAAAAAAQQEAVTATKSVIPEEGLTAAILNRRCSELAAQRRGKDAVKQLRELSALLKLSYQFGPRTEIPITMNCVAAQFALQRTLDDYMDTATWKSCAAYLTRVADVLDEGYTIQVETVDASDLILAKGNRKMKAALTSADGAMAAVAADEKLINPTTGAAETEDERAERLRVEKEAEMTEEEKKVICVTGSLSLHLTRLEEEYTKSLQKVSHHSEDYIVRLRDESKLVLLLSRFQAYFERINDTEAAAVLAQLRVEHLYYRHDSIAVPVDKAAVFYEKYGEATALHPACIVADASVVGSTDFSTVHPGAALGKPSLPETEPVDFEVVMGDLCQYVYKHATDAQKTRAMICQIYHAALHDRFVDARDLLLMSHLQESIYDSDVATMILFNRMMVTLGMCAFRLGRIHDAHQCLYDICSGRVRELLAQGVNTSRFSDKSAEQEKAEKRRLVPYHQHINLDLLEACHLISAMLLEVPNMAGTPVDGDSGGRRHRVISRTFRKFHDQYNHQVFTGPPEQTRDFIMRAAKSLMNGDWKNCASLVTGMDVWNLVPGEGAAKVITDMLTDKIKLEGLRTYLFAFSAQYDSLSLSQLCDMFEMSKTQVHSVVSKMMINRELYASWDQSTETIVLRKVEPSSLQIMALQFSEKASVLVEANERLLDAQSGGYGYKDDRDDRGGRGGYRGRGDGGGYRGGGGDYNNRNGRGGGGRSGGNNGRGGGRGGRGRSNGRGGGRGRGGRSGRGSGRGGRSNSNNNRRY